MVIKSFSCVLLLAWVWFLQFCMLLLYLQHHYRCHSIPVREKATYSYDWHQHASEETERDRERQRETERDRERERARKKRDGAKQDATQAQHRQP